MELSGENQQPHQEVNEQFQPQPGLCWCKGGSNLGEQLYSFKKLLGEQLQILMTKIELLQEDVAAIKGSTVPNLSSLQSSDLPPTSKDSSISLQHLATSPASRRYRLQFKSNIPDSTLYTLAKIEDQCPLLEVELLDQSGKRVEDDLETPVKIKIDVINGDFDVEENVNWTQKDYNENIVKPRKPKGDLLYGECKVALCRGVANLGHLRFTDNSTRMSNKMFRLGATAEGLCSGEVPKAAVSQKIRVKDCRSKSQRKNKEPSPEDDLCCLDGIAKNGQFYNRACEAGISTVKDFLLRLNTDAKELKKILRVGEANWNKIVKNAKACKLPEVANERLDAQISDQELTYRPCNIQSGQGLELLQQSGPSPRSSPLPLPLPCHGSEHIDVGGFGHSSKEGCIIPSPICNISYSDIDQYFVDISPATIDQGPMYGSSTHENGELLEAQEWLQEYLLNDSPQEWLQEYLLNDSPQRGEKGIVSEESSHDHVTSKLVAVCYVTKAAAMFLVSVQQDLSASKKKRKLH